MGYFEHFSFFLLTIPNSWVYFEGMKTKWFTLLIENPPQDLACKFVKNCAGQYVLDGAYTEDLALKTAKDLSFGCDKVSVFSGKRIGRLIAVFIKGKAECSYCGKAHL